MELMMKRCVVLVFSPAIGVIFGVMDPESLTAPAVSGKEEKVFIRRISAGVSRLCEKFHKRAKSACHHAPD
jgi:hypothetical protein